MVKGPLAVRPVYVHKQERILAWSSGTMVALLLFALLELLLRRAGLPLSGQQFFRRLRAAVAGRPAPARRSSPRHVTGLAPPVETLLRPTPGPLSPRMHSPVAVRVINPCEIQTKNGAAYSPSDGKARRLEARGSSTVKTLPTPTLLLTPMLPAALRPATWQRQNPGRLHVPDRAVSPW